VIFPRRAGVSLFDDVTAACRRSGFDPIIGHEAPQISSVANLVSAELGVSIVPASIAAQIRVKGIIYLPVLGGISRFRISLAIRLNEKSDIVRNFRGLAAACDEGSPGN